MSTVNSRIYVGNPFPDRMIATIVLRHLRGQSFPLVVDEFQVPRQGGAAQGGAHRDATHRDRMRHGCS